MRCDACGKETYCLYITENYKRICDACNDKNRDQIHTKMKEHWPLMVCSIDLRDTILIKI